jgi:hypothetical protein
MNQWVLGGEVALHGVFAWRLMVSDRKIKRLEAAEERRKKTHQQIFEMESNSDLIEQEMNRTADFIEARNTGRLTAPRPDAGPPAIVHRPNLRSVQPRTDREKFFGKSSNQVDVSDSED